MIALTRSRQLILASVLSLPLIVSVGAVGHLLSLEASTPQPVLVPTVEDGKTEPILSIAPSLPEPPQAQTDRERQNAAQAQLQDGDWLMKRGQFKAAKSVYQALLDRSDLGQDSDMQTLASQRLEKLEKAIVAANLEDKRNRDKLKATAKKKSLLKPDIKSAVKPTPKPVALAATPSAPLSVSSPEYQETFPGELPSGNALQPSSARDLTGTRRVGENVRFEHPSDRTTEAVEAGFEPEVVPVTPRLVPNSFAE